MTSGLLHALKVLLVEDDPDDYVITSELLAAQPRTRFAVEWCSDYDCALRAIRERRHEVYLIDSELGERTGLELIREGLSTAPSGPAILLTSAADYELDLEASTLGVRDFLVKQDLDKALLERSIRYAVSHHRAMSELALSEERYALAVRAANDGIWDWDLRAEELYLSPRWHALLGYAERHGPAPAAAWLDLVHEEDLPRLRAEIDAHLAGDTDHLESEHRMRHASGSWRWVLTRGLAIRDQLGAATRMAGSISDITDRRRAERAIQHHALHDVLTGLPNRALLIDRIDQIQQHVLRDGRPGCAILFLDLDRFKLVNDSLSHTVGDHLLIALAGRLQSVLRPGDTVARIGGDEFALLIDDVGEEPHARLAAERVLGALREPFSIDGHQLFVTAGIGIALSEPGMVASELLRNADIAMFAAKRRGRTSVAMFDQRMHREVVDRVVRENELRTAVQRSLMPVHFQPIVDLDSGAICALEALARWPSAWNEVTPGDFIPIAEEIGMIGELGHHVLRCAIDALAQWRADGLISEQVYISVNVSQRELEHPRLPAQVRLALADAGLPPDALALEITESTLMREPESIQRITSQVCAAGVGLQLDDFGTGYSSLAALHRFPVGALKIDRSFVASLVDEGSDNEAIIRSTIALAHSLGLRVIAEGIEDVRQLRRLRSLGCRYGQGFLFSRPRDPEQTRKLLSSWSPARAALLGAPAG